MPKTDDATPPAPNTSWRDDTSAMRAVSAAVARHAARDAKRGAKGLWARWRADPAGHAVTALTTVLILAVFVLAQSARASIPASADIGPPALTRAAEMRATAVAVDTPEPTPGAQTGQAPAWGTGLPAGVTRWAAEIDAAAERHDVPARLVACVMAQESVGRVDALSSAGASGLMQVHPPSHPSYDVARGIREPAYAIDYGTAYLASLLKATGGDVIDALGRYNGGQGWRAFAESNTYVRVVGACNNA